MSHDEARADGTGPRHPIPSPHTTGLQVSGTHGYRVFVYPSFGYTIGGVKFGVVTLVAWRADALVGYTVKGRVDGGSIEAEFGRLGRVSVQFHSTGRKRAVRQLGTCGARQRQVPIGTWTGDISFRGERAYTSVHAHRATASVSPALYDQCSPASTNYHLLSSGGGRVSAAGGGINNYVAIVAEEAAAGSAVNVLITRFRSRHGMRVLRAVRQTAPSASFTYEPSAASASFEGDGGLRGSASYVRTLLAACNQVKGTWRGDLSARLPGKPWVRLAGPAFVGRLDTPGEDQPPPASACAA